MTTLALFIEYLESDPLFFFSVVVTVIVSITLHELAHGWVAVQLGDDTPIRQKRMTLNPIVHMGMPSIVMLMVVGLAWGAMPINPSRLRGRYGGAWVALAGPASNLLLAGAAGLGLAMWQRLGGPADSALVGNWRNFLWIFCFFNIALAMFNLLPAPPLDGSAALGDFVPAYRRWISRVNPWIPFAVVIGLIIVAGRLGYGLFDLSADIAARYILLIRGY